MLSKTIREAVRRLSVHPQLDEVEVDAYVPRARPTMPRRLSHVGRVMQREIHIIRYALGRHGVDLVHGLASFVEPYTVRVDALDGRRLLTADHILLAVGTP